LLHLGSSEICPLLLTLLEMAIGMQSHYRTALVAFGSETGTAQNVAEELGRLTERLRFMTRITELDNVDLVSYSHPGRRYVRSLWANRYGRTSFQALLLSSLSYQPPGKAICLEMLRNFGNDFGARVSLLDVYKICVSLPSDLVIVHTLSKPSQFAYLVGIILTMLGLIGLIENFVTGSHSLEDSLFAIGANQMSKIPKAWMAHLFHGLKPYDNIF